MSRKILTTILLVAVFALGIFAVAAQDDIIQVNTDDYGLVTVIADGRLNGLDLAAPVAVYTVYENIFDADGNPLQAVDGLQLLQIDPVTNNGEPLFDLSIAEVQQQLFNSPSNAIEADGFTLNYSPDTDWFWVASPPDAEGKVYTFQWQNPGIPLAAPTQTTRTTSVTTAATASPVAPDADASATPSP